jgi:hypothetical protein
MKIIITASIQTSFTANEVLVNHAKEAVSCFLGIKCKAYPNKITNTIL